MKQKFLKPIKVKIFYDEELKEITGKSFEEAVVSENLNFAQFLNFIFSSYPKIPKKFIPGTLGFLLNGKEPKENDILKDGNKLEILVFEIGDIRKRIESQVREIINYYQVDTTFEEIPLPPLSEQKKIVAYLDNLREKVEKLKKLQESQLKDLEALKQSILEKAFSGELIS